MRVKSTIIILILSVVFVASCRKDFENMNKDPDGFTTATTRSLFNKVIKSLYVQGGEQMYINNEILYPQIQLGALGSVAWGNYQIGTKATWDNYYRMMPNVRELESRLAEIDTSAEVSNMKAMLKILVAYQTFRLTDLFGDIPFTEAGLGYQDLDYLYPKYDSQESIYKTLLADLKWANDTIDETAIEQEPMRTFINFDNLFKGDMLMWRKFANSLRLRYALRMSDKEPQLAGEIISEILDNDLPIINGYDFNDYLGENVTITPSQMGYSNDANSWSFREHKNLRMGTNIFNQMAEHDSVDGSGICDVRMFYFFETNNNNKWVPYPQIAIGTESPIGGNPYGEHRDSPTNFPVKGEECIYSPFNYFLTRDRDNMPDILITGAEVHFLKAEAYLRGIGVAVNPGQAEIDYMQGLESSVKFWTEVMEESILPNDQDADFFERIQVPGHLDYSTLLNKVAFWNVTSDDEKLKLLIAQRWLDHFRQPWEAFALTRRTNLTPREGNPMQYFRLPYPASEETYNRSNMDEALGGNLNSSDIKMWWMN